MSKEIKKMIIENFINHTWSDDLVRETIMNGVDDYINEDHVDEIAQAGFHKVDENIKLYAQDYRGDTWEEICKVCGVSSDVIEMMIPFSKALVKPKLEKRPFRITYRMEVYVDAENEEDAKSKFEDLDLTEEKTEFVELVSVEEED